MAVETYKYYQPDTNLSAAYGGAVIQAFGDSAEVSAATLSIRRVCFLLNLPQNGTDQLFVIGTASTPSAGSTWIRVSDNFYPSISAALTATEVATVVSSAPTGFTVSSAQARFQPNSRKTTIYVRGDSISAGLGTTSGLPDQVYSKQAIELISGEVLTTLAASASDKREMISRSFRLNNISLGGSSWANTVDVGTGENLYPLPENLAYNQRVRTIPMNGGNIAFIYWLGTNDLNYDASLTGEQVWTRAQTRLDALSTLFPNLIIILGTVIKRSVSATLNGRINDYNNALRAGYAAAGAHVLMDFEALVPEVNIATGNVSDTSIYTDTTHLTTLGHTKLAPVCRDAILAAQALF